MKTYLETGWWLPLALLALSAAPARQAADDSKQTTPVPVLPRTVERVDVAKNDFRMPIMAPIRSGAPQPACDDPPSDREVLRAVTGGDGNAARNIDECKILFERIVDKIDPPRFFPLVGPAQLHHCRWKCTVYYTEMVRVDHVVHFALKTRRVQVIYIDKDYLHQSFGPEAAEAPEPPRNMEERLDDSDAARQIREEWSRFWHGK
jgi:hypothetical protein